MGMNDRLITLLQRFTLHIAPIRPTPLPQPVAPDTTLPGQPGWMHLLLRGPVQLDGVGDAQPTVGRHQWLQPALVWLPAPRAHTLRPLSDQGTTLLSAPVHFGDPALNPLIDALPEVLVLPRREMTGPMAATWTLLVNEHEAAGCAHGEVLARLAEVLLLQALRRTVEGARGRVGLLGALSDDRLRRVLDAIHAHPEHPWTLESLAAEAGLSRTALATQFRATVGVPPGDYLTGWRLRLARTLLAQGRAVKEVADTVGYTSPAALTRVFTQRLGHPPTHWWTDRR